MPSLFGMSFQMFISKIKVSLGFGSIVYLFISRFQFFSVKTPRIYLIMFTTVLCYKAWEKNNTLFSVHIFILVFLNSALLAVVEMDIYDYHFLHTLKFSSFHMCVTQTVWLKSSWWNEKYLNYKLSHSYSFVEHNFSW